MSRGRADGQRGSEKGDGRGNGNANSSYKSFCTSRNSCSVSHRILPPAPVIVRQVGGSAVSNARRRAHLRGEDPAARFRWSNMTLLRSARGRGMKLIADRQ